MFLLPQNLGMSHLLCKTTPKAGKWLIWHKNFVAGAVFGQIDAACLQGLKKNFVKLPSDLKDAGRSKATESHLFLHYILLLYGGTYSLKKLIINWWNNILKFLIFQVIKHHSTLQNSSKLPRRLPGSSAIIH